MKINGLEFFMTCSCCPEQYDVHNESDEMVGYVRLRWGCLTCEFPDVGGELIYSADIGDGYTGEFENDDQRTYHLTAIADAINERLAL